VTEGATPIEPPRRAPRWLWLALALSLALNAAGAGLWWGMALRERHAAAEGALTLRHAMRDAAEPVRRTARDVFAQHRPAFEALRREAVAARTRVGEAAGREPFDPAALDAALAGLRAAQDALAALRHRALAEIVAAAPPETRAALAMRLSGPRGHRGGGRGRDEEEKGEKSAGED
jgi:Spy/CpxP family protein refolding chaperone